MASRMITDWHLIKQDSTGFTIKFDTEGHTDSVRHDVNYLVKLLQAHYKDSKQQNELVDEPNPTEVS